MDEWRPSVDKLKNAGFSWQLCKKVTKFASSLEESGAVNLKVSESNGSIKFRMPPNATERDMIFSFLLERNSGKVKLRYSKRTQLMQVVWL